MIEADIVIGYLTEDATRKMQNVMGHPPIIESDITLKSFLTQIIEFNKELDEEKRKGVKLDFKSAEVFQRTLPILIELWEAIEYPVWISADVCRGPPADSLITLVDPKIFFDGAKQLPKVTLSLAWTTRKAPEGGYTMKQIDDMIDEVKRNKITNHITFAVLAGIASQSLMQLDHLYNSLCESNSITFTIWSSDYDIVDVEKLRQLIFHFGLDKVYLDIPEMLQKKLQLKLSN